MPDYALFEIFLSICCCNLITWRDLEKSSYQESPNYKESL